LKKVVVSLFAMLLLFSAGSVSAFAAEKPSLNKAVQKVVGTPYKYGGTTTAGFDCSGFVRHIYSQYGIKLPRTSKEQSKAGTFVKKAELKPGDLVFFNTSGRGVSHAGIYIGDGKFAHASSSKGVTITKLSDSYYAKRYVTARRFAGKEGQKEFI